MGGDGGDEAVGVVVEEFQDLVLGRGVGDLREPLEVAEPEHGLDRLGLAALDLAPQHAAGRVGAEIGLEQHAAGVDADDRLVGEPEQRHHAPEQVDLGVAEPARPVGLEGQHHPLHLGERADLAEAHRQRDVVGAAVVAHELVEHRELALLVVVAEAAAQLAPLVLVESVERAPAPALLPPVLLPARPLEPLVL